MQYTGIFFAYKAAPSLAIVLNYGIFYLIGGLLFAYQDGMAQKDMHHLLVVAFLVVVIWFELRQKPGKMAELSEGTTFKFGKIARNLENLTICSHHQTSEH